jgi:PAS domain S-box-containing protein
MSYLRKVLVIGADPGTVSLYSGYLESIGFSLTTASRGKSILETVRDSEAEAVLLDLSSSNSGGAEALSSIKSQPAFESLPLFVLANGTAVKLAGELAADTRVKVLQKASPPAAIARAIEETLNARKDGSNAASIPQAQLPVNGDRPDEEDLIQDVRPLTRKLGEIVRTFCRTPERERRIELLAVIREEARRLRNTFSAGNSQALATLTFALERLFTGLSNDVGGVNSSTLKTVSQAIDFLVQATSSASGQNEMERTPIRMLAVDDDPVCLRMLMMLSSENKGLSVVGCGGAEPALRLLKTDQFDLIFSDILMPEINGFEFVAEVRKLPQHYTTPVVFVTGLSDFETRSRSVLSGGCDLIAKPFTAGEVLVRALTLGLKRRFDSAAAVVQVERQPPQLRPNGAPPDSEAPSPNNGGNGHATSEPRSLKLQGVAARGVIVLEEHGGIRSINMAAAELLGYGPDEAANGDVRALIPDELQAEENRTLLSQALAGKVKNKNGIKMTGRRKDNSTVQLLVAVGETWMGQKRSIICLLQAASPTVAATEEVSAPAVGASSAPAIDANPVTAELTSRLDQLPTTPEELIRAKNYWETSLTESLANAAAGRRDADQATGELAANRKREEDLRSQLKAAEAALAGLEKNRIALGQELGQAQEKVSEWESRTGELESKLRAELGQRENWERRAVELEQARVAQAGENGQERESLRTELKVAAATVAGLEQKQAAMEAKIREWAEREGQLKSECARLEQQGQGLTESLSQTQASLAQEAASRTAAERQAGEQAELRRGLEQELAASRQQKESLGAELKAAEATVAELNMKQAALDQELGQAQEKTSGLASRMEALESKLHEEVGQREIRERRAAELERARETLDVEIRGWAEREGQLKSECARLEQQDQELTESLSQTQTSLAKEAANRTAAEQQVVESAQLRKALEQELAASRQQQENLRAELKAAEATVTGLNMKQAALDQDLGQAQEKTSGLASRMEALESKLHEEVGQREIWERRAAELERARKALDGEIREWAEREGQLKSECARLEQQGQGLTESLSQTQALLTQEAVGRTAAERQAGEQAELRRRLEQELAASRQQKENLGAELTAAQAVVAGLEQKQAALDQELGQAQALLAQETEGRTAVEQQVRELAVLRRTLEQDLAASRQRQENLGAELTETQATVAGLEQKQATLKGEIRKWAEREGRLKSECARLAQQGQGLTELLSQTQALLAQEEAGRTTAERQAREVAELRRALEQDFAASQRQKENLGAELAAAQAARAELEQKQAALEGWIREWSEREGQRKSECARFEQQGQRMAELEDKLREEVGQRENWEQRAAEMAQANMALKGKIREWVEREGRLKSDCAGLEQKGQALTKSLSETQALLAKEADGRKLAEQEAGKFEKRLRALERDLAASQKREDNPLANPKAGEGSVKPRLPHVRAERTPLNLFQRLGQIARRSMMLSRKPFKFGSQRDTGQLRRSQDPEQPNAELGAARRPIRASAGIARKRDQAARRTPSRTAERVRRLRAAIGGNRRATGSNRTPSGRGRSQQGSRKV